MMATTNDYPGMPNQTKTAPPLPNTRTKKSETRPAQTEAKTGVPVTVPQEPPAAPVQPIATAETFPAFAPVSIPGPEPTAPRIFPMNGQPAPYGFYMRPEPYAPYSEETSGEAMRELSTSFVTAAEDKMTTMCRNTAVGGAPYLPWANAWIRLKKEYPKAIFRYMTDMDGNPYILDKNLGYRVGIHLSLDGINYLPVVQRAVYDSTYNTMKDIPYTYKTKNGEKICAAATYGDIEKAQMRCLVKAIALYTGIGLAVAANLEGGASFGTMIEPELINELRERLKNIPGLSITALLAKVCAEYGPAVSKLEDVNFTQYSMLLNECKKQENRIRREEYAKKLKERFKAVKGTTLQKELEAMPEGLGENKPASDSVSDLSMLSHDQYEYLVQRCAELEAKQAKSAEQKTPAPAQARRSGSK